MEAANLHGDFAARKSALTTLVGLEPNDPAAWSSLAESCMSHRQYQQAVQSYRKLLEVEPEDVNAMNQLGYAAAYAGSFDTALDALRRYQALRPAEANPLDSQGDVNLLAGRLREAENLYLQAAKKDPNFESGGDLWKAAMARLMSGDVAGADTLAQQYIQAREAAKDPVARVPQGRMVLGQRPAQVRLAGPRDLRARSRKRPLAGIRLPRLFPARRMEPGDGRPRRRRTTGAERGPPRRPFFRRCRHGGALPGPASGLLVGVVRARGAALPQRLRGSPQGFRAGLRAPARQAIPARIAAVEATVRWRQPVRAIPACR